MNDHQRWAVIYHRKIEKEIRRLPKESIKRTVEMIESLAIDPNPHGSKKIKGHNLWRVQVGVYRILYHIDEENRIVTTYRTGHRSSVYRNL